MCKTHHVPHLSEQYQSYTTLLAGGENLENYRQTIHKKPYNDPVNDFVISATNINLCKHLIVFSRLHQATVQYK